MYLFKKMFAVAMVVVVITMKAATSAEVCTSLRPVTVSVNGYRNDTGHWISQVVMEGRRTHGGGLEAWQSSGCYHVDVELRPITCENGENYADVVLTFSVHPTMKHNVQLMTPPITPYVEKPLFHPPVGYVTLQGIGYYKHYAKALSWSAARKVCREDGADLANIDSLQKLNFVKVLGSGWTWIDLHERGTNGVYYTASDEVWVQPDALQWYPGQPNYNGGADCILLLMADGRIGDTPCEPHLRHYLCEIPWQS